MKIEKSTRRSKSNDLDRREQSSIPSKAFYDQLDKCVKLHDAFDKAIEIGRAEGFEDHEIAQFMKDYLKKKVPQKTLWRWLQPLTEVERLEKKTRTRQELVKQADKIKIPNCQLFLGDFRNTKIDAESIDLIFTDPPYDQKSIPLYGDLAIFAERVLKPGGSLVTYFGQYRLLDFGNEVQNAGLKYWWILCVKHAGASASFFTRKVFVDWKPLLWFVKGDKPNNLEYMHDLIQSEAPDKSKFNPNEQSKGWQQSTVEAEHLISALTVEGQIILDPMMGAGTTGIATLHLKRKFIGIEIDEENYKIAKTNIAKSGAPI